MELKAMQTTTLNYYNRIMLSQMIGNYSVPTLREASIYLRILEKIRMSDEEATTSKLTTVGERISWELPSLDYGTKEVSFENEEADALVKALESIATPIKVGDAAWMSKLVDDLTTSRKLEVVTA